MSASSQGGRPPHQPSPSGPQDQGASPDPTAGMGGEPAGVWSVSELTARIAAQMRGFGRVAVEGEVVGLKLAGSGHLYFGLRDLDSVLGCAIWRSRVQSALPFRIEEGMRVICHGELDVYRPRGTYSMIVSRVEQRGIGQLLARLEQLKGELRERGWFDRKRPLPSMPRMIGLVTSRDTAAFQDFLRTRSMRWPGYPVRLAHTAVQGQGAERGIAEAIAALDQSGVDLIAVIRGGGSLEDLWCFNELCVAEAVWHASVPVISGVGHETDATLVDFVADYRAHTPTDAAQVVIPDRRTREEALERAGAYLAQAMDRQLTMREERLERLAASRSLRSAGLLIDEREERLLGLERRLSSAVAQTLDRRSARLAGLAAGLSAESPERRLAQIETRLAELGPRLVAVGSRATEGADRRLALAARSLAATSPFAVLSRGYSITRKAGSRAPLLSAQGLQSGDRIETLLDKGRLISTFVEGVDDPERAGAEEGS